MGTIKGEYIAVKDLYGNWSGAVSVAIGLMYNTKVGRRALLNGIVKYDHWITTLTASDFTATAKGGNVKDLVTVESYGEDVDKVKHNLDVTFEPSVIAENKETTTKSIHVVATQFGSNNKLELVCTQAAGAEVITISVTSVSASTIPASGGYSTITISWNLYKNGSFYKSGTSYPSKIYGSSAYDAYVSGNQVYMKSAGTTYYSSSRAVFTISSMEFYADGKLYEYNDSVVVRQQANVYSGSQYDVQANTSSSSISVLGGTFYVSAECYYYNTFTSGSVDYNNPVAATANVTFSNGVSSVSPTQFSGKATIEAYVSENFGASRYPRVTVASRDLSSASDSASVSQAAASYTFSKGSNQEASGDATTVYVTFTSERNGKSWQPTFTASSGATIGTISQSGSTYTVQVKLEANTTGSVRYISVEAVQSRYSGNVTETITITQAAQGVKKEDAEILFDEVVYDDSMLTKVRYSVRLSAYPSSKFNGVTSAKFDLALNTRENGTGTNVSGFVNLSQSLTVSAGSISRTFSGTINVPSSYRGSELFLVGYINNKVLNGMAIEESGDFEEF